MQSMKGKKYGLKAGLLVLLAAVCTTAGVYAYLSARADRTNKMTFGQNTIETDEEFPDPEPEPGGSVKKVVRVKNTGDVPCFVRTRIVFSSGEAESVSSIDLNGVDWTEEKEDGYHYYRHILPVGESTEPLMSAVRIADHAHLDELEDFDIIVYSESIQSEGYGEGQYQEAFKTLTD